VKDFGQRRASLEQQTGAFARATEQHLESPANPEIIFRADGLQAHFSLDLLEGEATIFGGRLEKSVHVSDTWLREGSEKLRDPNGGVQ